MGIPSETLRRLDERREVIASNWYEAIAGTCYAAKSAQEVRQALQELAGKAIDLLAAAPLDASQAEEIGVALARLHYVQAEALGGTLEVLGEQLKDGRTDEGADEYLSRLAALLGAIAAGFFREACRTVLAEQVTVLHYVVDHEEAALAVRTFGSALAPGSLMPIAHSASECEVPERTRLRELFGAASRRVSRSTAQVRRFFDGFELVEPGLVLTSLRRPEGPGDFLLAEPECGFTVAGVGRKL